MCLTCEIKGKNSQTWIKRKQGKNQNFERKANFAASLQHFFPYVVLWYVPALHLSPLPVWSYDCTLPCHCPCPYACVLRLGAVFGSVMIDRVFLLPLLDLEGTRRSSPLADDGQQQA